ncbi:MAG TPA: Rv2578c family radical SAM protein [Pilimelia sp.]|nr:Rv2578c family radical SAM protein [Pilimelia sp.]
MRWQSLTLRPDGAPGLASPAARAAPPLPLALPDAVVRTFDSPAFAGMTFYEVRARSIINRVPDASRVPFRWTLNPYRGCTHACVYCFARRTHTYLDLDPGRDFDSRIVVKVNAGELLRRELAAPRWSGAQLAMGTNVDCYQRAEGRYRLMPPIIEALRDFANPFSILTKGTLILRDLPLLRQAASVTRVGLSFSVGFLDETLWRAVEPGAPGPRRRLDAVRVLSDAGFQVGVLLAPILPGLSDSPESIDATVAAVAAAGAVSVTPLPLHLRPGAREWYAAWLTARFPELAARYRRLYGRGSYAPAAYQEEVTARVWAAAERHGLPRPQVDPQGAPAPHRRGAMPDRPAATGSRDGTPDHRGAEGRPAADPPPGTPTQLALL